MTEPIDNPMAHVRPLPPVVPPLAVLFSKLQQAHKSKAISKQKHSPSNGRKEFRMLLPELTSLLPKCKHFKQTKQVHAQIITNNLLPAFLHHLLLSPPSNPHYIHLLFNQLPHPDAFTYACTIRYFSLHTRFKHATLIYTQMHRPTTFAVSGALKACARLPGNTLGVSIHAQVMKLGYVSDVYVQTALVDFYSKVGVMENAEKVFDEMPERNVVSWNSILFGYLKAGELKNARRIFDEIPVEVKDVVSWNSMVSGYVKNGDVKEAEFLFEKMPDRNAASWNAIISGFTDRGEMEEARRLFDEMPCRSNVSWITMISGYARCGDVWCASELFGKMGDKDLLAWNAMISCYAQNSKPKEAIELFNRMRTPEVNVQPDKMTFACIISACSQLGDLEFGLCTETCMREVGVEMDDHLATALIDLYAKCGCIDKAYDLFRSLKQKDVVSCTAMILGCGINGKPLEAIRLFQEMVTARILPNAVTYTGILTAYNHAGLVEEGYRCFSSMSIKHGLMPTADHYGIMVDLLGRAGQLKEAYQLIKMMPMRPHAGVWGALLLACRLHCNVELGEIAAQHCIELESDTSGYYSLLANIYSSAERWDDAKRLRKVMETKKLSKIPGCSWMEST